LVDFIYKETRFIDPAMRLTFYTKTIPPQLKDQDNTIKQEQNKENIINGKI
jgi:hypothetical protein